MDRQPRLTLAVIVKNEADLLEGLLQHHVGLYDEAVVVDTGSTDSSRAVAQAAGAVVLDFSWIDDFSAARNHGLNKANCPWILQLDCDERIDPLSFSSLRNRVEKIPDRCFELPINNYSASVQGGEWRETQGENQAFSLGAPGFIRTHPVRLFPNLKELRFSGVVHENLLGNIKKMGLGIERATPVIHHTGLLQQEGLHRREVLYTRLLEKKISLTPEDLNAQTEYAKLLSSQGKLQAAEKIMVDALAEEQIMGQHAVANLFLIEIHARLGKLEQALARLKPTIHQHPNHLLCWVQASAIHLARDETNIARIYLDQGRKLFPESAVLQELQAKV